MRRLLVVALLAGCSSSNPATPASSPDGAGVVLSAAPVPPKPHPGSPLSQAEFPTTDGAIALGNFEGLRELREKTLAEGKGATVDNLAALVDIYSTRAQFLGRVADYERAAELAERMVKQWPKDPHGYLMRAGTRSTFHRFSAALADLDTAEKLGLPVEKSSPIRASVLQAMGRLDESLVLREKLTAAARNLTNLAAEAILRADRGEIDRAAQMFIESQQVYPNVSPFPVAWLYFQEGLMWQRRGRLARARELFAAARERLPTYAVDTAHLAAVTAQMGERDAAIALLQPLAGASDDPEFAGQLAQLYLEGGKKDEAAPLIARARKRFDEILKAHPEAYADHAARFYLAAGGDARRAFALADANLKVRPTVEAHELALEAALATSDGAAACRIGEQAATLPYATAHLHVLASRAFEGCGKKDRAALELKAAGSTTTPH